MPPSMASVRSCRVLVILGSSTTHSAPKTMKKPIAPTMTSTQLGTSGFGELAAASWLNMGGYLFRGVLLDEERDCDADQGERLGQREANPHEAGDPASCLGLTRDRLDRVAEDEADADARADSREAVRQRTQVLEAERLRDIGTRG